MSATDLLTEIQKLPYIEQVKLLDNLSQSVRETQDKMTDEEKEAEVIRLLMERGILNQIPEGLTDDEEAFEPIENTGKPLSEVVIEGRR